MKNANYIGGKWRITPKAKESRNFEYKNGDWYPKKEKKQTHIKNKMIEKQHYEPFCTLEGDDTVYDIRGFNPDIMLPDEDVYKTKKKEKSTSTKGLEEFMEKTKKNEDSTDY